MRIPANALLVGATGVASIAILGCVMSTSPTNEFPVISYLCFLMFEFAAGAYFPSMAEMKRQVSGALDWGTADMIPFLEPISIFSRHMLVDNGHLCLCQYYSIRPGNVNPAKNLRLRVTEAERGHKNQI